MVGRISVKCVRALSFFDPSLFFLCVVAMLASSCVANLTIQCFLFQIVKHSVYWRGCKFFGLCFCSGCSGDPSWSIEYYNKVGLCTELYFHFVPDGIWFVSCNYLIALA